MLFHAQVAEGIFLISSDISGPDSDGRSLKPGRATANSYLVVGDEKALLFDMAVNEPWVADYARSLADKPVFPVLSHGSTAARSSSAHCSPSSPLHWQP